MTREEAIKKLQNFADHACPNEEFLMAIKALEQETKTGRWIFGIWNYREHYFCSECNRVVNYEPCYHYCPFCGAKMESEE